MIERADTTPRFARTGMRRLVSAVVICAGACVAGPDSDVRAQLQLAMLEPVPLGQATVEGPCFGARPPGITLIVAVGDAPPR